MQAVLVLSTFVKDRWDSTSVAVSAMEKSKSGSAYKNDCFAGLSWI